MMFHSNVQDDNDDV